MNTNEHVRRPHALTLKPARRSRPKLRLDPPTGAVERRIREVHWLPERRLLEVDAIAGGHPLYGERLVELGVLTVEFPRETGVVKPEPAVEYRRDHSLGRHPRCRRQRRTESVVEHSASVGARQSDQSIGPVITVRRERHDDPVGPTTKPRRRER